jgi:ferrous iron transport protein B
MGVVTFPQPPDNATMPAINYSLAGQLGHFNSSYICAYWVYMGNMYCTIPAMAAREVVIAALGVIYAMSGDEDTVTQSLLSQISGPDGWG